MVSAQQRFTRQHPCPVCGGHDQVERGNGSRCYGYRSNDGSYANCTREEYSGGLPQHEDKTYGHRLNGDCRCGKLHDSSPPASNGTGRKIVATYDYTDEGGNVLFQADFPKDFSQRQPDGKGSWISNLKGVRRVLYRLPQLILADSSEPVFLVEGEKGVDRLRDAGFVATCNPMGAEKWLDVYSAYLRDRSVVVLPDNDQAGQRHGLKVASSLYGVAKIVRVLELPGFVGVGNGRLRHLR